MSNIVYCRYTFKYSLVSTKKIGDDVYISYDGKKDALRIYLRGLQNVEPTQVLTQDIKVATDTMSRIVCVEINSCVTSLDCHFFDCQQTLDGIPPIQPRFVKIDDENVYVQISSRPSTEETEEHRSITLHKSGGKIIGLKIGERLIPLELGVSSTYNTLNLNNTMDSFYDNQYHPDIVTNESKNSIFQQIKKRVNNFISGASNLCHHTDKEEQDYFHYFN